MIDARFRAYPIWERHPALEYRRSPFKTIYAQRRSKKRRHAGQRPVF